MNWWLLLLWIVFVLGGMGVMAMVVWRAKRLPSLSTDKLWEIVDHPNKRLLHVAAIIELNKRGEDMTPVLPRVLRMMVSRQLVFRMLGSGAMRECFPELIEGIDYDPRRVTPEVRAYLEGLADDAEQAAGG